MLQIDADAIVGNLYLLPAAFGKVKDPQVIVVLKLLLRLASELAPEHIQLAAASRTDSSSVAASWRRTAYIKGRKWHMCIMSYMVAGTTLNPDSIFPRVASFQSLRSLQCNLLPDGK